MANGNSKSPSVLVDRYIDESPMKGLVLRVPILCGMLMLIEGMDTYGVGYVGPSLSQEYGLSPTILGTIYTGTVIASLIGAVLVAPLSDRIGRRRLLVISSFLMGLCTLLTSFAGSEGGLFVVRFLIGIGFGTAVPTAFSLTADYAPARHKSVIIMATMSGIALGMALAGIAAALLIPVFGWKSLLFFSGGLSMLWTILLALGLPESLSFLVRYRPGSPQIASIGSRLASARGENHPPHFHVPASTMAESGANPAAQILRDGRHVMTFLLWFAMSAAYSLEFFTSYWLPTVLLQSGANMFATGMITALGKFGSIAGAIVIGLVMDRLGAARVLTISYILTGVAIVLLGSSGANPTFGVTMIFITFFLLDGSFAGIQALTANSYPGDIRATGVGWVTGFARLLGGGTGTMIGGILVEVSLSVRTISICMAVVMILGSLAVSHLWRGGARHRPQRAATQ
ncbi:MULTISPECIES: MFS transporter [unclassified Sphingobium]|uniref:MFS transporter n=1 Tax=unclassified Sphingobium TaxID=2611147 RepID=UPI0007703328|nr:MULTISPECIES: MFS transporter [Sphingomonadaceae]AMK21485.1 4-hydroxybenzoate transporter PcaK [Sphingobium sp. TKS]NML90458.1 MFS transporter [Sphingobium sp. TB-6]